MLYVDNMGWRRIRIRKVRNGKTEKEILDFATWKATIEQGCFASMYATLFRMLL